MSTLDSLIGTFARFMGGVYRGLPTPPAQAALQDPNSAITTYRILRAAYESNGFYDQAVYLLNQEPVWHEALFPLRMCANRVVEFYAAKLWPGADLSEALPIIDAKQNVEDSITQVWKWSNWASQKQVFARWLAIYGDGFIKVATRENPKQVYFQLLEPETATQIDADNRGFLTYLRLDVPKVRRDPRTGKESSYWLTEVWNKEAGTLRTWEHDKGAGTELTQLGTPTRDELIRALVGDDFIPVVHTRFRDIGDLRGAGAFTHALDKINEANRMATRLHQLLFRNNKVTWALAANMMTGDNRPMPPPRMEGESATSTTPAYTVALGDDEMVRLPGMTTLEPLIPQLQYEAALNILNAHMTELERDLPELTYYRIQEFGSQLSGRAVRLLLTTAIDRALEAQGNARAGLVRADQMALTIGQHIGALQVGGSFDAGTFDHDFEAIPVINTDEFEDAQTSLFQAQAGAAWVELGVSQQEWLRKHNYNEKDITRMAAEKEATADAMGTQLLDAFNRGQVGVNGNGRN